jgi:hypothetical protein
MRCGSTSWVGVLVAVGVGACSSTSVDRTHPPFAACTDNPDVPPAMPLVHVGPDQDVMVFCGTKVPVPIASLSSLGGRPFSWVVTPIGSPEVRAEMTSGTVCRDNGVTIVSAMVSVPFTAMPGDAYAATFIFKAVHDEFPRATVEVQAHVVTWDISIEPADVEFGDLMPYMQVERKVTFRNNSTLRTSIKPATAPELPVSFTPPMFDIEPATAVNVIAAFAASEPGDYWGEQAWIVTGPGGSTCTGNRRVTLHARVGAPDAGVDRPVAP